MISLGINTLVWTGHLEEAAYPLFGKIRAWGYDVVEVTVFDFDALKPAPLRRAVEDAGLALSMCTALPATLSLLSPDAGIRTATREWIRRAVDKVAATGSPIFVGPLYSPVGVLVGRRRTEAEWQWAVEELRRVDEAIRGSGVRIAIEPINRFETYFVNTVDDTRKLCAAAGGDSLGILFDTFHAGIEENDIIGALTSLGNWLFHVHLSENNRGVPGTGHVPFGRVADALRAVNYSGYAVVESFATSIPEIAGATAMWRDYAASSDDFAARSIANLRPLFAARAG